MVIFSGNTWRRNVGLWVKYALLRDFNKRTINVTQQSKNHFCAVGSSI